MRTYGRVPVDPNVPGGSQKWVVVTTDANGYDDAVWLTTLAQALKLNLGESPFYADYGIPAKPSVVQQVFPDFYVARTQQRFAPRFASLIVSAKRTADGTPTYLINVTTNQGVKVIGEVPT